MPIDETEGIERENISSLFVCSFITIVVSVRSGDTLHQHVPTQNHVKYLDPFCMHTNSFFLFQAYTA